MPDKLKYLALGLMIGLAGLFFGYNGTNNSSRYQIAGSYGAPQMFVLDTETGQTYRYVFFFPNSGVGVQETIRVESLGTPENPIYELVVEMYGRSRDVGGNSYQHQWGY